MCLTNEHVGQTKSAKIKICVLTRAELLIHLCYEIPCNSRMSASDTDLLVKLEVSQSGNAATFNFME